MEKNQTQANDNGKQLISGALGALAGFIIGSRSQDTKSGNSNSPPTGGTINVNNVFPDLWSSIFNDGGLTKDEYINFGVYCYIQKPFIQLVADIEDINSGLTVDQKALVIRDFLQRIQCRQMNLPVRRNIAGFHAIYEPALGLKDGSICVLNNMLIESNGIFLVQDYPGSTLLDEAFILCPPRHKVRQLHLHEKHRNSVSSDFKLVFDLYKDEFDENDSFSLRSFANLSSLTFGDGIVSSSTKVRDLLSLYERFNLFFDKGGIGCYVYGKRQDEIPKFKHLYQAAQAIILD